MAYSAKEKSTGHAQGLREISSAQKEDLGQPYRTSDGRVYRYCRAGATALAAAKVMVQAAPTANCNNEALSSAQSAALGATTVTITNGGTALAANYFKEGFFHINDATGEGHIYKVASHPAFTSDNSYTVTITLLDPIEVALVASTSEWTLTKNKYDSVIVLAAATAAIAGVPVCIPPVVVTAEYYFWGQTKGPAAVLTNGTLIIGNLAIPDATASTGVAGAVMPYVADTNAVHKSNIASGWAIGRVMHVNADDEYSLIDLMLE